MASTPSFRDRLKAAYQFGPRFRKQRRWLFGIIAALVLLPVAFVAYVIGDMPSLRQLENPNTDLSTQILSSDGVLLGTVYKDQNRVTARFADLPLHLQNALIATEDVRFYDHSGIDPKFVFLSPALILTGGLRGGSTITQQLARNLYNESVGFDRSLFRKVKEAIVASYLERRFTKPEILTLYFNTVNFGGTIYGVQAAAKKYFGKDVKDLTVEEGALLVGMLKATGSYNPIKNPEASKGRRNVVLSQMEKYGFLTAEAADSLRAKPLNLANVTVGEEHNEGLATYFRTEVQKWLKTWCDKRGLNMYTSGLRVYTTLNARLQKHAEVATREHLASLQKLFEKQVKGREPWRGGVDTGVVRRAMTQSAYYYTLKQGGKSEAEIKRAFGQKHAMRVFAYNAQGYVDTTMTPYDSVRYYARFMQPGFICINPSNGHILAWVGGLDQRYFKYDHVRVSRRQVGSTFKPFVYTAAFDNGFSPCQEELNMPVTIEFDDKVWSPRNADRDMGGYMTLRKALALSKNLVTARLVKALGPQVVAEYAYKMGVTSKLDVVPSIALGTSDLSVYELTSAYATIADMGRWHEPIMVTRIEDRNGTVLEEFVGNSREAINEATAYMVIDGLRAVVNEGTAASLRWSYNIPGGVDMGGKTGTTQNHADGWFMGITPTMAAGVWVGCSDRTVRFPTLEYGQGGRMAMPIWGKFMKLAYEDKELNLPKILFQRPASLTAELDCRKYKRAHPTPESPNGQTGEADRPQALDFNN